MLVVQDVPEVPSAPMVAPMKPYPIGPSAPLAPSVVTGRYWTREGLDRPLVPLVLRDGAQGVEVLHWDDDAKWVGDYAFREPVYCGPAAPYPRSPAIARIGDRFSVVYDVRLSGAGVLS